MEVVSVNVGLPRQVEWKGKMVTTGIFKEPVAGRIAVGKLNLAGDGQADLSVHGGPSKAVYAYPAEHYDYWCSELPDMELPWGMFGENFTTTGLAEDTLRIGDEFRVGTARVVVTEPRMPCFKLGLRFGRSDMVKRFLRSGRTGFYFGVLEEGHVTVGDAIEELARSKHDVTVADVTRLYTLERDDVDLLRRAVAAPALGESWRGYFQHQLEKLEA